MNTTRNMLTVVVMMAAIALASGAASATTIFVVDAPNDQNSLARGSRSVSPYNGAAVSQTFDLSTGGDSAAGLSGTLAVTRTGWFEPNGPALAERFNDDYAGDMNGGNDIATWTATGYVPGTEVNVYSTWRSRGHYAGAAPYTINGGAPIPMSMKTASVGDLVLADPAGGANVNFQTIGTGFADIAGQVQVIVTGASGWTPVDAIALETVSVPGGPIPEPATMCALGLAIAGLGGYVRRRRKA